MKPASRNASGTSSTIDYSKWDKFARELSDSEDADSDDDGELYGDDTTQSVAHTHDDDLVHPPSPKREAVVGGHRHSPPPTNNNNSPRTHHDRRSQGDHQKESHQRDDTRSPPNHRTTNQQQCADCQDAHADDDDDDLHGYDNAPPPTNLAGLYSFNDNQVERLESRTFTAEEAELISNPRFFEEFLASGLNVQERNDLFSSFSQAKERFNKIFDDAFASNGASGEHASASPSSTSNEDAPPSGMSPNSGMNRSTVSPQEFLAQITEGVARGLSVAAATSSQQHQRKRRPKKPTLTSYRSQNADTNTSHHSDSSHRADSNGSHRAESNSNHHAESNSNHHAESNSTTHHLLPPRMSGDGGGPKAQYTIDYSKWDKLAAELTDSDDSTVDNNAHDVASSNDLESLDTAHSRQQREHLFAAGVAEKPDGRGKSRSKRNVRKNRSKLAVGTRQKSPPATMSATTNEAFPSSALNLAFGPPDDASTSVLDVDDDPFGPIPPELAVSSIINESAALGANARKRGFRCESDHHDHHHHHDQDHAHHHHHHPDDFFDGDSDSEIVELPLVSLMNWTIDSFSSRRNEHVPIYSPTHVDEAECEWRFIFYPEGEKGDNWVSLFIEVPDADDLPFGWSRRASFTITIPNMHHPTKAYSRSDTHSFCSIGGDSSWGWPHFIQRDRLLSDGFVKDDKLHIIAEIELEMVGDDIADEDLPGYLCAAASKGDLVGMQHCIDYGVDANALYRGNNALHNVCMATETNVEALKKLYMDGSIDLDLPNSDGETAVLLASFYGHPELVFELVNYGARLDVGPSGNGLCALGAAAQQGQIKAAKLLIDHGAPVAGLGPSCCVPLKQAIQMKRWKCAMALIAFGCPVVPDTYDEDYLVFAAKHGPVELIDMLLQSGADPNALDRSGDSVIATLIERNMPELALSATKNFGGSIQRCSRDRKKVIHAKLILALQQKKEAREAVGASRRNPDKGIGASGASAKGAKSPNAIEVEVTPDSISAADELARQLCEEEEAAEKKKEKNAKKKKKKKERKRMEKQKLLQEQQEAEKLKREEEERVAEAKRKAKEEKRAKELEAKRQREQQEEEQRAKQREQEEEQRRKAEEKRKKADAKKRKAEDAKRVRDAAALAASKERAAKKAQADRARDRVAPTKLVVAGEPSLNGGTATTTTPKHARSAKKAAATAKSTAATSEKTAAEQERLHNAQATPEKITTSGTVTKVFGGAHGYCFVNESIFCARGVVELLASWPPMEGDKVEVTAVQDANRNNWKAVRYVLLQRQSRQQAATSIVAPMDTPTLNDIADPVVGGVPMVMVGGSSEQQHKQLGTPVHQQLGTPVHQQQPPVDDGIMGDAGFGLGVAIGSMSLGVSSHGAGLGGPPSSGTAGVPAQFLGTPDHQFAIEQPDLDMTLPVDLRIPAALAFQGSTSHQQQHEPGSGDSFVFGTAHGDTSSLLPSSFTVNTAVYQQQQPQQHDFGGGIVSDAGYGAGIAPLYNRHGSMGNMTNGAEMGSPGTASTLAAIGFDDVLPTTQNSPPQGGGSQSRLSIFQSLHSADDREGDVRVDNNDTWDHGIKELLSPLGTDVVATESNVGASSMRIW